MVQRDFLSGRVIPVRVPKQHQPPHNGKQRQKCRPQRVLGPADTPGPFHYADGQRQDTVHFVLEHFRVASAKCLRNRH